MDIKQIFKDYVYPAAVFSGGMIGVGFLSLPYVAMKAGIWLTLFYFVVLTAIVVFIDLIFVKISLKTPDFKRFPGFVGHYLGKYAETLAMLAVIFGGVGVLLAYLIVGGEFLTSALSPFLGGNILTYTFIYFLLGTLIIYFDIKIISKIEFWALALLLASLILVAFQGMPFFKTGRIFYFDPQSAIQNLFLPYGALLFSLWGAGLIPEAEEMIRQKKGNLKKIVGFSTLAVSVFYLLFVFLILGISGSVTTQTALAGLERFLGQGFLSVALFAGALATFTAFISQGTILKKTFVYDLRIKHWQALIMACFTPMVLFLAGLKSIIPLISFIGGVLFGMNGILILLMFKKIGGKNIVIYPLSIVFLAGIIYEIIYFVK